MHLRTRSRTWAPHPSPPLHGRLVLGLLVLGLLLVGPLLAAAPVDAQSSDRSSDPSSDPLRPIGYEAFETWNTIGTRQISDDGAWVVYTLTKEDGDDELVVRATAGPDEHRIERGTSPEFALDGQRVVYRIRPYVEATREANSDRDGEQPRDSLGILDLTTGERTAEPMLQAFELSPDEARYLAIHLRPEADEAPGEGDETKEHGTLLIRDLETGATATHWYASDFEWAPEGTVLLAVLSPPAADATPESGGTSEPNEPPESNEPSADNAAPDHAGLHWIDAASGEMTTVIAARGEFSQLTFDETATRIAFLHSDTPDAEDANESEGDERSDPEPSWSLHHWAPGMSTPTTVTTSAGEGLRDGWELSEHGNVSFSDDGTRIFFGTRPRPEPAPEDRPRLETDVDVEVWHWQDEDLMTVQRVRENQERRRSYTAVHVLGDGAGEGVSGGGVSSTSAPGERIVQLADPDLPGVTVGRDGDGHWAVGTTTRPYAIEASWESPSYRDSWLVEVDSGERTLLARRTQGSPSLSPDEGWLTWYEPGDSTWYAQATGSDERRDLGAAIPHPLWNEQNDTPSPAGSYGGAGWMDGESRILLHDAHDIWAVNPADPTDAISLTGGHGRAEDLRYRLVRLDREQDTWDSSQTELASVFDRETRDAGFARIDLGNTAAPELLILEPRSFSTPARASDADIVLFTQETYRDFPDLWVADPAFEDRTRISEANPQQAEYRWGDARLVHWTSLDGVELDGILITPEDFDPDRPYPMMVYFYERNSDNLHSHYAPVPHRSIINFPMYASHDYLVFIPDIVYRDGYPGESAYNAIMPGVTTLLDRGFVDRDRIAMQGHSWGGYQIAFMVTRTEGLFRAAAAGAPVANMTSAYGGIRWDSGLVRQFQYERTQSRLGHNLWDAPLRYIENSPLFWVDKIETPLLIMHNDQDGAVPFEQGIELFTAMRRLSKPAWLINYTGEPHWPTSFANKRDWNIRMKQFFDHFLKDEAPPVWMVEGVPAIARDRTLGLEPVEGATVVDPDGRRP